MALPSQPQEILTVHKTEIKHIEKTREAEEKGTYFFKMPKPITNAPSVTTPLGKISIFLARGRNVTFSVFKN